MNEYEEWKTDPVAQKEYTQYLLEEAQKTDPTLDEFINQFTNQFNKIFKEKS
jgi:hypothetical protein